jgi:hypothetical protein
MIPSDTTFICDQKEISGDFTFKCRIDDPIKERIFVRDYVYDMAKKELVDCHHVVDNDILELIATYFKVDQSVSVPCENYIICMLAGKFKMIRRDK